MTRRQFTKQSKIKDGTTDIMFATACVSISPRRFTVTGPREMPPLYIRVILRAMLMNARASLMGIYDDIDGVAYEVFLLMIYWLRVEFSSFSPRRRRRRPATSAASYSERRHRLPPSSSQLSAPCQRTPLFTAS